MIDLNLFTIYYYKQNIENRDKGKWKDDKMNIFLTILKIFLDYPRSF